MKDSLVKVALHCLPLGLAMVLAFLNVSDTCARSPEPTRSLTSCADASSTDEDDSTQTLAAEVNNPTAPLSLSQFREALAPSVSGAEGPANLFEMQPGLPLSSSPIIPFHQLIKITLPIETSPGPRRTTGLGDFLNSFVGEEDGSEVYFHGAYAHVSYLLTGESRPYDRRRGVFTRLHPRRDFSFRNGGLGAWEIAGRISHADLNDGNISGGR